VKAERRLVPAVGHSVQNEATGPFDAGVPSPTCPWKAETGSYGRSPPPFIRDYALLQGPEISSGASFIKSLSVKIEKAFTGQTGHQNRVMSM